LVDRDPAFKTDRLASVIADFGSGRTLNFIVSTQLGAHQRVTLGGTKGRIEIVIPFNAPPWEPMTLITDDGAVLGETEFPYGVEDGIKNMQIIDAIFRSEKTGRWEKTGL